MVVVDSQETTAQTHIHIYLDQLLNISEREVLHAFHQVGHGDDLLAAPLPRHLHQQQKLLHRKASSHVVVKQGRRGVELLR